MQRAGGHTDITGKGGATDPAQQGTFITSSSVVADALASLTVTRVAGRQARTNFWITQPADGWRPPVGTLFREESCLQNKKKSPQQH